MKEITVVADVVVAIVVGVVVVDDYDRHHHHDPRYSYVVVGGGGVAVAGPTVTHLIGSGSPVPVPEVVMLMVLMMTTMMRVQGMLRVAIVDRYGPLHYRCYGTGLIRMMAVEQ
jgi:hypothetical protein